MFGFGAKQFSQAMNGFGSKLTSLGNWGRRQANKVETIAAGIEKIPIIGSAARAVTAPVRAVAGLAGDGFSVLSAGGEAVQEVGRLARHGVSQSHRLREAEHRARDFSKKAKQLKF